MDTIHEHDCMKLLVPSYELYRDRPYVYCQVCGDMFFANKEDRDPWVGDTVDLSLPENLYRGGENRFREHFPPSTGSSKP